MRPRARRGTHTEEPHISRTADAQDRPTPWVDMAPGLRRLISERAGATTFVSDARSPRTVDARRAGRRRGPVGGRARGPRRGAGRQGAAVDRGPARVRRRAPRGDRDRTVLGAGRPGRAARGGRAGPRAGRARAGAHRPRRPGRCGRGAADRGAASALARPTRPPRPPPRRMPTSCSSRPTASPRAPVGTSTAPAAGPGSVLLLTSGSTGTPKAVELTEAQCLHVAGAVAAHHRLTRTDRGFCPLPLFHVNAQVVGPAGDPGRGRRAGARPAVPAHRLLGAAGRAGRDLGERRPRDRHDPRPRRRGPGRARRAALRALGVGGAAAPGAGSLRRPHRPAGRGELRDDRSGEPDHRDPAAARHTGPARSGGRWAPSCGSWTTGAGRARPASSVACGSAGRG